MTRRLERLFQAAAAARPSAPAVEDPDRDVSITYQQLERQSAVLAESLERAGIGPGDRVGVCAPKSIASVSALLGIMRAGAAYVPVDPTAPASRNAFIFQDCGVRAVLADPALAAGLAQESGGEEFAVAETCDVRDATGAELVRLTGAKEDPSASTHAPHDLAYVLYTSGSTGRPKGVMHTHGSALAFVDWCVETFRPTPEDRFSSHAPFHFDLSIHDLYVPLTIGGTLVLIGEDSGKQPRALAQIAAERRISIWYSTPSILRLMVEYGQMSPDDYGALRIVHFAGEVFPSKHLRAIKSIWTRPRYFNLYGPTETNVCTYYEVPETVPEDRTEPFPIGFPCSGDRCAVVEDDGSRVAQGSLGELWVAGPSVMAGYWNLPDRSAAAFAVDDQGVSWYRTGDMVRDMGDECFAFQGRRDRMVKRRGYRVELGEIEAALYRHKEIGEAAVVALPDEEAGVRVKAFVAWSGQGKPSTVRLKQFCSEQLPMYMIPDEFAFRDALPKTSTDKIDYQKLLAGA